MVRLVTTIHKKIFLYPSEYLNSTFPVSKHERCFLASCVVTDGECAFLLGG